MKKLTIKNRKGQNLVVLVEQIPDQKGLAFVMHGLGGFKEQPHIQTITDALQENKYTVVRFDTTNTFGESDGKYEEAALTNYYEDLEDVITWSKNQSWYQEPFCLAGHSFGGFCTAFYSENNPKKVKGVAPISTFISGELNSQSLDKKELEEWERTGWRIKESSSLPGVLKKLPWSHFENRFQYDLLRKVDELKMPVLLIVGELDDGIPPKHQKILYNKLKGKKELHIIKGAEHTFREKSHLQELKKIFNNWLKKLD